jgi:F-type H+-transporting ATPase subunit epsilon
MAEGRKLQVRMVSPDGVIWEGPSPFVVLPALDGEIGIAPGHAPLIVRLGAGEARIHAESGVISYLLSGGFLEVLGDRVHVLVDRAETPGTVNAETAREALRALDAPGVRNVDRAEEEFQARRFAQARIKATAPKKELGGF